MMSSSRTPPDTNFVVTKTEMRGEKLRKTLTPEQMLFANFLEGWAAAPRAQSHTCTHTHTLLRDKRATTQFPSVRILVSWTSNKTEHVRRQ